MGTRLRFASIAVAIFVALILISLFIPFTHSQYGDPLGWNYDQLRANQNNGSNSGNGQGPTCSENAGGDCSGIGTNGASCGGFTSYGYISQGEEEDPSVGYCDFTNYSIGVTTYIDSAGNGTIVMNPVSGITKAPVPVISDVLAKNDKYTPYLITCPLAPNPTNTTEYISDPGTFIAGDRCLASILPLITNVTMDTTVNVDGVGFFINLAGYTDGDAPTSASMFYTISNLSRGNLLNLGFSAESNVNGSAYNISATHSSLSYIFQQLNSTPQQGLWTWHAEYANLSKVNVTYLDMNYDSSKDSSASNLNAYYTGIDLGLEETTEIPLPVPILVGCAFSYNFKVHAQITNIANANTPIPIYNSIAIQSGNYLKIGRYIYSPVKTITSTSGCYGQMLASGSSCTSGSTGWLKIGTNASTTYQGQTYNNLPVYLNVPSGTTSLPANPTYIVPINANNVKVLLQATASTGVDMKLFSVFPYFIYNTVVPSTRSEFTPPTSLNLSYDIYSPNNYASTLNTSGVLTTPVEPYNIYSGSGLLANYSTKNRPSELADLPFAFSANTSNSSYDSFPLPVDKSQLTLQIPIPLASSGTSSALVFSDASIRLGTTDDLLFSDYPANTLIHATSQLDEDSGLPACTDDMGGGACVGSTTFDTSLSLSSNLFVFGDITVKSGVTVQTNGYAIITSGTVTGGDSIVSGVRTITYNTGLHGTINFKSILNPAFITESPNGFIYVINYSQTSGFLGFNTKTTSTLFKLKYIPTGDYNDSVFPPTKLPPAFDYVQWHAQANTYFEQSLLVHTPSLYLTSEAQFSETTVPNWCFLGHCLGSVSASAASQAGPFLPLAAAADYQSDLFLVGAPIGTSKTFSLAEITSNGKVIISNAINQPTGFLPAQEFAVSPGGEFVYLANASYPDINIYSTKGGNFQYVGDIPLSYSNSTYNMNISAYLSHGGPFSNNAIRDAYAEADSQATPLGVNDVDAFHHPIAITDVQGIIFVIDNWTFTQTTSIYSGGDSGPVSVSGLGGGSIWMLRAFLDNGTSEIPLGYSTNRTLFSSSIGPQIINPLASQISTGTLVQPPFGEPLTANITLPTGTHESICEYNGTGGCTTYGYIGSNSIGPQINSLGQATPITTSGYTTGLGGGVGFNGGGSTYTQTKANPLQLGVSSDFSGRIYLIAHDTVSQTPYTELLLLSPQVENYTNMELGIGVPFQCYANIPNLPDCATSNVISNLYPPLLGMPDAFEFLSGQGGPIQYFTLSTAISSLLPAGTPPSPDTANNFANGAPGEEQVAALVPNALSGAPLGASAPLRTFLNGTINGYVMTPYTITYKLHQEWKFQDSDQDLWDVNPLDATFLEEKCSFNPKPQDGTTVLYLNDVKKLNSSSVNQTIEGGSLYANTTFTQANYQPNLSDRNLVMPPYIQYNLFSNRLLGEIYINQTVSPTMANSTAAQLESYIGQNTGALGSLLGSLTGIGKPKVVNASRNYNYSEDTYVQLMENPNAAFSSDSALSNISSLLGTSGCTGTVCAPAFWAENATPTGTSPNNTIIGANCGSGGCPSNVAQQAGNLFGADELGSIGSLAGLSGYYYAENPVNGSTSFNYSNVNGTSYYNLFSLFHRMNNNYGLLLNLSNSPAIYGYNRLVYTYVDRFNNTVYMPVDVDFANTTLLTMGVNSVINATNFNQTKMDITGDLDYLKPNGTVVPVPVGSSVYLYYDTDMNYFNLSAVSDLSGPSTGPSANYFKWAENCAFNPQDSTCILANPLSNFGLGSLLGGLDGMDGLGQDQLQSLASEGLGGLTNTVTYHPNFGSSNSCPAQPNSLLTLNQYNCNINGQALTTAAPANSPDQLPAIAYNNGNVQYCVPQFSNGTGTLTSQLGLMAVVQPDSNGTFTFNTVACGIDSGRIIAHYYGYPNPEPINVGQSNLQHSVTAMDSNTANDVVSPEYNYYFAPNETSIPVQTGSYQLSLGNLYAWIPIIIILVLLLASKAALGQSGGLFELFGFATLYDMATGLGLGAGARGKGLQSGYKMGQSSPPGSFFDRLKDYRGSKQQIANQKAAMQKQQAGQIGVPPIIPPLPPLLPGKGTPPRIGAPPGNVGMVNMSLAQKGFGRVLNPVKNFLGNSANEMAAYNYSKFDRFDRKGNKISGVSPYASDEEVIEAHNKKVAELSARMCSYSAYRAKAADMSKQLKQAKDDLEGIKKRSALAKTDKEKAALAAEKTKLDENKELVLEKIDKAGLKTTPKEEIRTHISYWVESQKEAMQEKNEETRAWQWVKKNRGIK